MTIPKPTVHFVYVTGTSKAAPMCITNEVHKRLLEHFPVKLYDWLEHRKIMPIKGDILLGHPHPDPLTIFQQSFNNPYFAKRIVMSPLAHAMPEYIAFLDPMVSAADCYLAITGNYWIKTLHESLVSHWSDKVIHLDLAVERSDYPTIERAWNKKGERRFLYIGSTGKNKGTDLLAKLSLAVPDTEFAWLGHGPEIGGKVVHLGSRDLTTPESRALIANYDFLLHLGRSDANPTTILEALSWSCIPVCTKGSGYEGLPWLINISEKTHEAAKTISELQSLPEGFLMDLVQAAKSELSSHFTWDRFFDQVLTALKEPGPRIMSEENLRLSVSRKQKLKQLAARKLRSDKLKNVLSRIERLFTKGAKLWR